MANPNGQEYPNETEVDVCDSEPLTNSGFESENSESDFAQAAEE